MTTSPDLGIPFIDQQQAQPEVTHNEALLLLQALTNGVIDRAVDTPAVGPTIGDSYIIGAAPTGAWAGRANCVTIWSGTAWDFIPGENSSGTPITMGARQEGMRVWVRDEDALYIWSGSAWTLFSPPVADNSVTNAKLADMATQTIKGRTTAGTGDPEDLTATQVRTLINVADGANAYVHPNHSGDVTSVGDGAQTIAADAVTNTKLANMATQTIKGRTTAGTGDPEDLTAAQVRTVINVANGATALPAVATFTGNKTLALSDINTYSVSQDATAQTVTIPAQATVTWTADAEIHIEQGAAGAVTVAGATGVSVNGVSAGSFTLAAQKSVVTLKRTASDTWTLIGRLAGATTAENGVINGLYLSWNSATSISVSSGSAHIPGGSGSVVGQGSTITKSGLTLSASTNYHVYVFQVGSGLDAEVVTTAPSAPYVGTARAKSGDNSRRYVGSVLTDGSGAVVQFSAAGVTVSYYSEADSVPFRVLSAGIATAGTAVSFSSIVPVTAKNAVVRFLSDAGVASRWSNSDIAGAVGGTTQYILPVGPNSSAILAFPLSSALDIVYWNTATTTGVGAYIDCMGYVYER